MIREEFRSHLHTIGIAVWSRRYQPSTSKTDDVLPGWNSLSSTVRACRKCQLHRTRASTVLGAGSKSPPCLIIGEAPGAEEDRIGEPFVGRAGHLLTAMLRSIGLTREQVYITNMVKCRPPGNRDPLEEEIESCEPYLLRQIEMLSPKVIVATGRIAAQSLLHTTEPLGRLRGRVHSHGATLLPMIVTYHPAYLLRRPRQKSESWDDLRLLKSIMEQV